MYTIDWPIALTTSLLFLLGDQGVPAMKVLLKERLIFAWEIL
jgi:hypothetical protein